MAKSIEVRIKRDGTVSIEALGITGGGCHELTRALEQALGITESVQSKPEEFVVLDDTQLWAHESDEE